MTTRNFDALFRPKSVALIGASDRSHSVGAVIIRNIREAGFEGPVLPVNPKHQSVAGILCYPDVQSLPIVPDLAVLCTPPQTIPKLIDELGRKGARAAIIITAGFREGSNSEGAALQTAMLEAAKPFLLRVVGPNCLGVISTPNKLNASFAPGAPKPGSVAFVAQSGAMVAAVLDWATGRGVGFSHMVSLGDMSDADFGDMLDFLATDTNTSAILLYIEAVTASRKFMSAARAAARLKPVIAIKAGRQPAAARAATSHTGALAGIDGVYDAAFERAGVLRAYDLDELFDSVETLATRQHIDGGRLAIITNGGGAGVLATDALIALGGELADLSEPTLQSLSSALPSTWSHGNPIDIIGDADATRYAKALSIIADAPEADAALVLNCPVAVASSTDAARAVIGAKIKKPLFTNWLGAQSAQAARELFGTAGIPTFETPEKAVRGFMHVVRYHRSQETLREVPPSIPSAFKPDVRKVAQLVAASCAKGVGWLEASDVFTVLSSYGIPIPRSTTVTTPEEAARTAVEFGMPVVLKIVSPDITHKSDVGGVALNLEGHDTVKSAVTAMLDHIKKAAPSSRIQGLLVQEMVRRPNAFELILGMAVDKTFGPFLLFGQGGTAVEIINDKALGLPPLNPKLAREMMARTRVWRLLTGYRDHPPAALDEIAITLVKLSQLVSDFDEIAELDINPLLADAHGVVALDARIKLEPSFAKPERHDRLAIKPYPSELESNLDIPGAGRFRMRPVRPEDAPAFTELGAHLSLEDVRMRFFTPYHTLPPILLARLTQIDYDREMAFVLFDSNGAATAVARLEEDPEGQRAEFAVLVRTDLKGHGIGKALMKKLIEYASAKGIVEIWGDVLFENAAMVGLCNDLGFRILPPSHGVVRVTRGV